MKTLRYGGAVVLACGFLSACTETKQELDLATYRAKIVSENVPNGINPNIHNAGILGFGNGIGLFNAPCLNCIPNSQQIGIHNGTDWAWVQGEGFPLSKCTSADGTAVSGLTYDGSLIRGYLGPNKKPISGTDFRGVSCEMPSTTAGTSITVKFDEIALDTAFAHVKDVWTYQMSAKTNKGDAWPSICTDAAGAPVPMVPVVGSYWDLDTGNRVDNEKTMTMGCVSGAIGKCVRIGYRNWATGTSCKGWERDRDKKKDNCEQVPLKDHHQACTRMIRADYCGNGQPHTLNGTLISVMDYLQPVILLDEDKWQIEARWTPTGAICLTEPRHPELWTDGGCKDSKGKLTPFRKCEPYEVQRGLIVSAFEENSPKPGKK